MFESYQKELNYCTHCPRLCQSACPVLATDHNQTHSPWGLMQTLNLVKKEVLPFTKEIGEMAYQCTTCGACTELCEHSVPVADVLQLAREKAVEKKVAPKPIDGFLTKFHRHNNPFSKDLLAKLKGLFDEEILKKQSSTVYFASCTTIAKTAELIQDTFTLFEKLGVGFVSLFQDPIQCCGYPLYSGGLTEDFIDLAEINYQSLKHKEVIISGSPTCTYTLKHTYKKFDFDLSEKVISINEFLEPYLKNVNFQVKPQLKTKVIFHDPCYSCRYLDEKDLSRDLIQTITGTLPAEFYNHGKKTECSGQGGCYSIVEKERSDQIAQKRLAEVNERQIQTVITQCPSCIHKFRKNSNRLIVKDLVSYLNDCISQAKNKKQTKQE